MIHAPKANKKNQNITEEDVTILISEANVARDERPDATIIDEGPRIQFLGASASAAEETASSQAPTFGDNRPPVYNKQRGSKKMAMDIMNCRVKRKAALEAYRKDKMSSGDTACFNLKTWE